MKRSTRIIHKLVRQTGCENQVFAASRLVPFMTKCLPLPSEYSTGYSKKVQRNGVSFELDLSDYMQWHIFADLPDNSWKAAKGLTDQPQTVLDIGANCGAFTLKLGSYFRHKAYVKSKVISFEPNPGAFANLKQNLELNSGLEENVVIHNLGMAAQAGRYSMQVDAHNSGAGKVISTEGGQIGIEVKLDSVDNFISHNNLSPVSFIKVDVEGYEPEVISGGWGTIKKDKPQLFLEVTPEWWRDQQVDWIDLLREIEAQGYELLIDLEDHFQPLDFDRPPTERQFNLWARHER